MDLSRRKFLTAGLGACVPNLLSSGRSGLCGAPNFATINLPRHQASQLSCVLLDLDARCALPESTAGYEKELAASACDFVRLPAEALPPPQAARAYLIPGCVNLDPATAAILVEFMEAGGLLLLESGAGFADPAEFDTHQRLLASRFALWVEPPVDLWSRGPHGRVPYVDYFWPIRAKIRDFSRVVPVSGSRGNVIAWADGLPVAVRHRVGRGTLILLGSPLGPALLWGDRESQDWLRRLLGTQQS
jgi:hypothetical protein